MIAAAYGGNVAKNPVTQAAIRRQREKARLALLPPQPEVPVEELTAANDDVREPLVFRAILVRAIPNEVVVDDTTPEPMSAPAPCVRHSFYAIEARILRLFNLSRSELHGRRRNKEIVLARQCLMYWSARLTRNSMPVLGRLLGGMDHTTILHGRKAYVNRRRAMGRHLREAR